MMDRRVALMAQEKSSARIPAAYQEVKYIGLNSSDTTQLIDTNVVPKTSIRFVTKYYFNASGWRSFFGSVIFSNNNKFSYTENSNQTNAIYAYGSYSTTKPVVSSAPYTWHDIDAGPSFVQDGTLCVSESSTAGKYDFSDNTISFKIGGGSNAKAWRVKECFVYDGGVLMADLIPCYRKSDGRIGLYDVIQNAFRMFPKTTNNVKGENVN